MEEDAEAGTNQQTHFGWRAVDHRRDGIRAVLNGKNKKKKETKKQNCSVTPMLLKSCGY